jgi:dual specificity tyrosine-phosphorylation-regulated kinase 1
MIAQGRPKNRDNLFAQTGAEEPDGSRAWALKRTGGGPLKPDPELLRKTIGADTNGPGGRRKGEPGHSARHYELFLSLVSGMLRYEKRLTPEQALGHAFFACDSVPSSSDRVTVPAPAPEPPAAVAEGTEEAAVVAAAAAAAVAAAAAAAEVTEGLASVALASPTPAGSTAGEEQDEVCDI